jgi:hypothetical protein
MILRDSAGRVCHLENVKFYMSYLQQYTKIIKTDIFTCENSGIYFTDKSP